MKGIFALNTRQRAKRPAVRLLVAGVLLELSLAGGWMIGLGLVGR